MPRTEEAAIGGLLTLTIGGRARAVPVLKIKHSREWKEKLGGVAAGIELDDDLAVTIGRLANLASDRALDLVVAYDRTDVLGGRDAIEEEATDAEVFQALEVIVRATYPFETVLRSVLEAFGPQLRELLMTILGNVAGSLSRANSQPTPSGIGASTLTALPNASPTNNSSSSGHTTNGRRPKTPVPTAT
jgi:hypothetical protein